MLKIAPPPQDADITRYCAFTLAEVLITLGIIGVVAAITMPVLLTAVTERVNSNREANIANKITQATDKMQALGLLNQKYENTDAFVNELQKHLKIAKRCSASNIADCWPTNTVRTSNEKIFEVKNAKKGENLFLKENISDNVGIVLADGAAIIMTYNQDANSVSETEPIIASNKTLPIGFGKSKEFAYTTSSTTAIDFVMDVNGGKGPNSETINNKFYDIRSFKLARFSEGCPGIEIKGIGCIYDIGIPNPISTCDDSEYSEYDDYGSANAYCSENRLAAAKKICAEANMQLPSLATLKNIYQKKSEYQELPQSGYYWASEENSNCPVKNACGNSVNFSNGNVNESTHYYKYRYNNAMCVEK